MGNQRANPQGLDGEDDVPRELGRLPDHPEAIVQNAIACAACMHANATASDWKRRNERFMSPKSIGSVRLAFGTTIAFSTAFAPRPRGWIVV
jgi:hypothetical protein